MLEAILILALLIVGYGVLLLVPVLALNMYLDHKAPNNIHGRQVDRHFC